MLLNLQQKILIANAVEMTINDINRSIFSNFRCQPVFKDKL